MKSETRGTDRCTQPALLRSAVWGFYALLTYGGLRGVKCGAGTRVTVTLYSMPASFSLFWSRHAYRHIGHSLGRVTLRSGTGGSSGLPEEPDRSSLPLGSGHIPCHGA